VLGIPIPIVWLGILTNLIVIGTIKSFHDYEQVLFWQTGIIAYQSNMLIFLLLITLILRRFYLEPEKKNTREIYVEIFLVLLAAGGICETWVIMQMAFFTVGLALTLTNQIPRRKQLTSYLFTGLLASGVAFFVTISAPGNAGHVPHIREITFATIWKSFISSFIDVANFLLEWGNNHTTQAILLLTSGFLAGLYVDNRRGKQANSIYRQCILLLGGCSYIMLWSGIFPGYAVFQVRPPDRALFTGLFIFIIAFTICGVLLGQVIQTYFSESRRQTLIAVTSIMVGLTIYWIPVRTANSLLEIAPTIRLYSQLWDIRDAEIRQRIGIGEQDLIVCNFRRLRELDRLDDTLWISGDLYESPTHWINVAASSYYGANSISTNITICN